MDCKQARNLFDAYLDGELSSALKTELDAHRLQCASCRQDLALMEVAGHVIQSGADEPTLDAEFADRLLACIEPTARPRQHLRWVYRIGAGLAAAACLIFVFSFLSGPEPQVASNVDIADPTGTPYPPVDEDAGPPMTAMGNADLEKAVVDLQKSVEGAVRDTRENSASVIQFVETTLLDLVGALQAQPDADAEDLDSVLTPEDPEDDVEDI